MRKWLKRLAGGGACLLAGAVFALGAFLARPGTLLTSRTVGAALKYFGADWSPRWSRLSFSADALGRRRHRYVLSAADFCVDDRKGVFSGCFSELELSAVVFYSRHGPVVERVERLVAVAERARLDLRRFESKVPPGGVPAALRSTSVGALRVELPRFTFLSSATAVTGGFRGVLAPGGPRPLSVAVDLHIRGASGAVRLKAELAADTDLLKGGAPTYVDLVGRADLGPRGRARAAFRVRREALGYAASGSAEVDLSTGPLRSLRLAACKGSAPLSAGAARPSEAKLSCRYELVPAEPLAGRFGEIKSAKGRAALSGRVDGERFSADLKADLDPIKAWYELTGALALRVAGRLDRPLADAAASHELRASAKVPRFEDLVALLRDTKYAVPAPIHVLKGPLSLVLESRGDPRADRQTVHYAFSSDLAEARQRLILRATGNLTVADARTRGRSFEHEGELLLKEVALELPRLDIARPPKVGYDKRIKADDGKPSPPSAGKAAAARPEIRPLPLRLRLAVRTEKPLILFSNLIKDPVPSIIDLAVTYPPAMAAGKISVRAFDVELFRRKATVDHMNVALSSGSEVGALEGLVRYQTPAVTINILILGTTAKPLVEFTSVPPLKREEIIALLIFGKSPEDLDPDQTASVDNTETALESQAFGLTSLYLFGATPIEHVGYDSATKTASVKLRLPGGANLTLGSDFDQSRQLNVRKPLSPHWALETVVTDQPQQSMDATTFLEWFNRY